MKGWKNQKTRPPRIVCVFLHENVANNVRIRENKTVGNFWEETFSKCSTMYEWVMKMAFLRGSAFGSNTSVLDNVGIDMFNSCWKTVESLIKSFYNILWEQCSGRNPDKIS